MINESICERRSPNKAVQIDNLQAVRFAVSLSLNFTAKQTAYKLRLTAALDHQKEKHRMDKPEIDYGKPPKSGWSSVVCELYVQNIVSSLDFWCNILGFEIAYQRPEECFAYLERSDGAQIMLYQSSEYSTTEESTDFSSRVLIQIFVDSLSPVLTEIQKTNGLCCLNRRMFGVDGVIAWEESER